MIGTRYTEVEYQRIRDKAKAIGVTLADYQRLATISVVIEMEREWERRP